jgi:hypothetical protein
MRWASCARGLRWLDAGAAWVAVWAGTASLLDWGLLSAALAAAVVGAGARAPVAAWWRPVSGAVGLAVSRGLRAGDRAWYVLPGEAEPVLVTARRGLRVVVARPGRDGAEGISVRRTRVLLLPAESR